ncbi:N-acyl homoserine lactonase family protein [Rhizobium sp. PAMB 3174]
MKRLILSGAFAALFAAGAAQSADLELWRLDCGSIKVNDLNAFSDTFAYTGMSRDLTDSCYLIRHGKSYMLWDTGLPAALLGAPQDASVMSPTLKATIPDQLKAIGVKPEEISIVGISHYHFDHVGQAADFPGATLMIGKADLDALKETPLPFGADPKMLSPWISGGAKADPVSGDRDVFGDGSVTILAAPGHTPGSQALLVRLQEMGPVLLSGDIVHFEEQFANHGVPPFNTNRAETLASMDRVEGIAKDLKATLVIQHDANDVKTLPAFPKSAR